MFHNSGSPPSASLISRPKVNPAIGRICAPHAILYHRLQPHAPPRHPSPSHRHFPREHVAPIVPQGCPRARARLDPRDATRCAHRPALRSRLLALSTQVCFGSREAKDRRDLGGGALNCRGADVPWIRAPKVRSNCHAPARVLRIQPASKPPSPASQVLDDDPIQWFGRASSTTPGEAAPPASSSRIQ